MVVRASLVGLALGVTTLAGGGLALFQTRGLMPATAGLVATFAVALAAGLWAGVPPDEEETPSLFGRWLFAGLSVGAAGAFATALGILTRLGRGGGGLRILALLFLIALPVYAIGFLLPPLIGWAEWEERDPADEEEDAEAGARRALGTVTVCLLLGAAVGALLAGLLLVPRVNPGPLLLGTAALLTSPVLFPRARRVETAEQTVYEAETPFGVVRVAETVYPGERQPDRVLYQDDEIESGELVRTGAPVFAYISAAERWLGEVAGRGDSYLFLGGGAYTLPRRIAEKDPTARIRVVELDPEVTRVAYRFFGLRPEHRIVSIHGDARAVAAGMRGTERFDRVYVDVYDGRESLPYSLVTAEAFGLFSELLAPGGTLALNVIGVSGGAGRKRLWSTVRTLCQVFPAVELYVHMEREYPERQNFLLAASMDPARRFPARAGLFEPWPRAEWPGWEGTLVFRDRFPAEERSAAALVADRGARRAGDV